MQTTTFNPFELKLELVPPNQYMPRVYDVKLPCQWLEHCKSGKCPAFKRINGNFYCAKKQTR